MKKIIGLVGTNSEQSTNRQLLQFMQHYFAQEADIELVEIVDFPMFNKPEDKALPEIVKTVAEKLKQQMASLSVRLNMTMRCRLL